MLNRPGDVGFDDNFYNECIQEKDNLEPNNLDMTTEPITLEDIKIWQNTKWGIKTRRHHSYFV